MYKYFIYYSFSAKDGRQGYGNMISSLNEPISDMKDILELQNSLKKEYNYIDTVVISNFILLSKFISL